MQTINNDIQLMNMMKRLFAWTAVFMTAFMLTACPPNNETEPKTTQPETTNQTTIQEPSVIDKTLYTHYAIGGTEIGQTIVSIISGDDTTQDMTGQIYMYNNDNFDVTSCTGEVTAFWFDAEVFAQNVMASGLNTSSLVDATPDMINSLLDKILTPHGKVVYVFDEDSYTATYNTKSSQSDEYNIFSKGEYVKFYKKTSEERLKSLSVSYDADYNVTDYETWEYNDRELVIDNKQYLIDTNHGLRWNVSSKQVEVSKGELTESYHATYEYDNQDRLIEDYIIEMHPHNEQNIKKWEIKSGEVTEVHNDNAAVEEYHTIRTRSYYYWNDYLKEGIPSIIETYSDNSVDQRDEYVTTRTFNRLTADYGDTYTITSQVQNSDGDVVIVKVQTYQRDPFDNDLFYLYMEEVSQSLSDTLTDYYTLIEDHYTMENIPYYVTSMSINSKLY